MITVITLFVYQDCAIRDTHARARKKIHGWNMFSQARITVQLPTLMIKYTIFALSPYIKSLATENSYSMP